MTRIPFHWQVTSSSEAKSLAAGELITQAGVRAASKCGGRMLSRRQLLRAAGAAPTAAVSLSPGRVQVATSERAESDYHVIAESYY